MHYGGDDFHAHDQKTHKKIEINKKLSPLDIDKLNHYYPPISKLAPALTALKSQANSNKILLSDHQETNRNHRVEENNATDNNFANNKANNNAIDDYNNDQIMVEFIKVGHI